MSNLLKFKAHYFVSALIILAIEILIALFAHDRIIRPYAGDFLVVILVYCFLRSLLDMSAGRLAFCALIFSYLVETLQYFDILGRLGLQDSRLAKTVIGSSFEWADMVAYTLGIIVVRCVEKAVIRQIKNAATGNFHAMPFYLLCIPLLMRFIIIEQAVEYSRNTAIRQSEKLIRDIETYHSNNQRYPPSLLSAPELNRQRGYFAVHHLPQSHWKRFLFD